MKKLLTALGGATALVLALAAPAAAHISPTITEAPAGGYATFALVIPHGCEDDSDTVTVEVQMPDGIDTATPQFIPGWEATVDDSGPVVVTWEGGPLPHEQFQEFGLSVQMPDAAGETVLFPTVQTCEGGSETAWIEETPEGGEEPEHPAPAITLTEGGEGHGHEEEEAAEEGAEEDEHAEEAAADAGEDEDSESDSLAIVALIVGALGLLTGGYAVMSSRRTP